MSLRILLMGTPAFAIPIFRSIYESKHSILGVYTQPPKKKDRGQKVQNSLVHNFAIKNNIPVRCPNSLEENEEFNYIKKLNPDLVIVVAYGKIIPIKLLNLDKTIFINAHASLLPKWRGAAPIQRAILNMDKETGVSIMKIEPKLDSGPILIQSKVKIFKETNHDELSSEMSKLGAKLIMQSLDLIENNKANFIEQNHALATYAKKIQKSELKISWKEEAKKVIAKINAFYPNPGCWFDFFGTRIKIIKAKEISMSGIPGEILDKKNLTIACLKNSVQILELKKEGKQVMSAEQFLRGNSITANKNLN